MKTKCRSSSSNIAGRHNANSMPVCRGNQDSTYICTMHVSYVHICICIVSWILTEQNYGFALSDKPRGISALSDISIERILT